MKFFGYSDIGRRRPTNQDRFLIRQFEDGFCVCAVFDGMGGAKGGEEASSIACGTFEESVSKSLAEGLEEGEQLTRTFAEKVLCTAAEAANSAVYARSTDPSLKGLGTTVVAAAVTDGFIVAINVGDSRLYEIGSGSIRQISKDNSYVQYLVDIGQITKEEALSHPQKNLITKCLGTDEPAEPDTYRLAYVPDYLLLCSDGLTNAVSEDDILSIVSNANEDGRTKVRRLVDAANEAGGQDNITVILAAGE
ncbi:MAG: Stp1/IreP family PP2C-type Ser/Thr phosphatase [Clostridia bacterium]|nr:Stp1/IreP family PP2C-type Ser/Thr phosphatase [Clostridia bacterium]